MNPDFRKVALIAASLGLLVSLFLALRPDDDDPAATTAARTTEQTTTEQTATRPPATTAPPPQPEAVRARITVSGDAAPTVRTLSVRQGREIILVVESEFTDHVHVHGYDLIADVAPGKPATIRLRASDSGIFEIELEERGLQIAELEVRP